VTEVVDTVCETCGGSGWVLVERDGVELARRCTCAEAERRRRLLDAAHIPRRYARCSLDSFDTSWAEPHDPTLAKAHRAVTEFVNLYPQVDQGLLLMGGIGTGKTHLAVGALQRLIIDKGVRGRFVDFTALLLEMQLHFDHPQERRALMRPLLEAEVLVLDELGARRPSSPWVMDLLYYLVNTRYVEERITLFTTNYSDFVRGNGLVAGGPTGAADGALRPVQESLRDRVSSRIRSRLYEMCRRIELRGKDYRHRRLAHGDERRTP
jgi:DNA replication protein DnaC